MTSEEDDPTLRGALAAFAADEPPAGFADGVMTALAGARRARRRRLGGALIAAGLAAALVLWVRGPRAADGAHRFDARASVALGERGTAVGEPGAALAFHVGRDGAARVTQSAGDVFYRVERGGAFVVATGAGTVAVQGTCFRVEVLPMTKQTIVAAGLGAAAATALLVTVYEGKVLLANAHGQVAVAAGEQGSATATAAPAKAEPTQSAHLAPPADGATREELLIRDRAQRAELAELKERLRRVESAPAAGGHNLRAPGHSFFEPTKDELKQLAAECKLQWDHPRIGATPATFGAAAAEKRGLSDAERDAYNRVVTELNTRTVGELRALYLEATGDKAGADTLSPDALMREIEEKSADADAQLAFYKLSRERAGMLPPGDPKSGSPYERMMRMLTSLGDRFERDLGQAIGPDRARSLREDNNGWPSHSTSSHGCPEGR